MTAIFSSTITLTDEQERAMAMIDDFMADPVRQVFNLHGLRHWEDHSAAPHRRPVQTRRVVLADR